MTKALVLLGFFQSIRLNGSAASCSKQYSCDMFAQCPSCFSESIKRCIHRKVYSLGRAMPLFLAAATIAFTSVPYTLSGIQKSDCACVIKQKSRRLLAYKIRAIKVTGYYGCCGVIASSQIA